MSEFQRVQACKDSLDILDTENVSIVKEKTAHFDIFDFRSHSFVDKTPGKLLTDMIKGYYSRNKGFVIKSLA